jgi:hypothetical protein
MMLSLALLVVGVVAVITTTVLLVRRNANRSGTCQFTLLRMRYRRSPRSSIEDVPGAQAQEREDMADLIAIGQFRDQIRGMVTPGASALFPILGRVTPDKAVEAMSKYGGTVLKTSLSKGDEKELQEALHGGQAAAAQ